MKEIFYSDRFCRAGHDGRPRDQTHVLVELLEADLTVAIIVELSKDHHRVILRHVLIYHPQQLRHPLELEVALPVLIAVYEQLVNVVYLFCVHQGLQPISYLCEFPLQVVLGLGHLVLDRYRKNLLQIPSVHRVTSDFRLLKRFLELFELYLAVSIDIEFCEHVLYLVIRQLSR
jgi:hypothetical protein